jgi:hypothetical protein
MDNMYVEMAIDAYLSNEATLEEFKEFLTNEGLTPEEVKAAVTELYKILLYHVILEARDES